MGFHVNKRNLGLSGEKYKSDMKLYVNAGTDTYEFARKLWEKCNEKNLNFYFKVVRPYMDEAARTDKMCIYISSKDAPMYIDILRKIREENPQFHYQNPPIIAGTVDDWIGVGMDPKRSEKSDPTSYNSLRAGIIQNAIEDVFSIKKDNMGRKNAYYRIKNDQSLVEKLRAKIKELAKQKGISEENFAIDDNLKDKFKQINLQKQSKEERHTGRQAVAEKKNKNVIGEKKAEGKPAEKKPAENKVSEEKTKESKNEDKNVVGEKKSERKTVAKKPAENKVSEEKPKESKNEDKNIDREKKTEGKPAEKKPPEEKTKKEIHASMEENLKELKELINKMSIDYNESSKDYSNDEDRLNKLLHKLYEQKAKNDGIKESLIEKRMNERRLDLIVSNVIVILRKIKLLDKMGEVSEVMLDEFNYSMDELNKYFKEKKSAQERESKQLDISTTADTVER